jgi:hypothetical protein
MALLKLTAAARFWSESASVRLCGVAEDRLPAAAEAVRLGAIAGSAWCGLGGDHQAQGGNREEPEEDDVDASPAPVPETRPSTTPQSN